MRRQLNNSHINSTNLFDRLSRKSLRTNTVTPDILGRPLWLHDDEPSGMEIIELNSSNEAATSPREPSRDHMSHAWSYVNNNEMQQIENSYRINEKARERRRLQNVNNLPTLPSAFTSTNPDNYDDASEFPNIVYPSHPIHVDDKLTLNHQMNCFTIINKHLVDSDTSTDGEYGDVEIITSDDVLMNTTNWDHQDNFYNEEIITYDTDLDQETRTIWIYSFKNKHLLSEGDFEAVNIRSKERSSSSTSYSTDSSGEQTRDNGTSACRLGSPTPATYIPRLDLSLVPTLSTVTEISERNMQPTPNESIKSAKKIKKHSNNWFISESAKEGSRPTRKHEKSTNIISWMALSPRDRRRVLKDKSLSDTWVGSRLNLTGICTSKVESQGDQTTEPLEPDDVKVHVNVEVHVDKSDKSENTSRLEHETAVVIKSNTDEITSINKIKFADATLEDFQKDRGDHDVNLMVLPAIRLTPRIRKTDISDPIEKLESSDWIREYREERETNVYNYELQRSESVLGVTNRANMVDHLWMKNTVPFLKPSPWNEFVPIAESPASYHLSVGSLEERKTWFRRLINFLKCCK